jgi:hypothetical protein
MLQHMTMISVSLRDLTLIAAYAAFLVTYFGYSFFGTKRAVAGAAVVATVVLLALLPYWAGLPALLIGFVGLIALSTHLHQQATMFNTSAVVLLRESLFRQTRA